MIKYLFNEKKNLKLYNVSKKITHIRFSSTEATSSVVLSSMYYLGAYGVLGIGLGIAGYFIYNKLKKIPEELDVSSSNIIPENLLNNPPIDNIPSEVLLKTLNEYVPIFSNDFFFSNSPAATAFITGGLAITYRFRMERLLQVAVAEALEAEAEAIRVAVAEALEAEAEAIRVAVAEALEAEAEMKRLVDEQEQDALEAEAEMERFAQFAVEMERLVDEQDALEAEASINKM